MDQKLDQVLHLLNSVVYTQQHQRTTGASGSGPGGGGGGPGSGGGRHGNTDLPTPTTPMHQQHYSPPHTGMTSLPSGSGVHNSSTTHIAPPRAASLTLTDHLQEGDV